MTPPNEAGPRDITPEGTDNILTSTPTTTKKQVAASDSNGAGPRHRSNGLVGRYVEGFQDGFDQGALDAMRLMGRRCHCVDCATEAEKIAEYYSGAADRRAS